ncbi:MAG: DNA polymerase IV [Reichenbachiella sp.]
MTEIVNPYDINRSIVHMDLDTFFVSCERRLDSRLNGKPILIGGTSDRGVVAACSYEARAFGIHSAMPMKMARQLCPEAIIIKGNSMTYSKCSNEITEIIKSAVPTFEKSSIDEFYIDLTGMDRFFGCLQIASDLRKSITDNTGLPISFGLSINKTVSKIATGEAKPDNQISIDTGTEKTFLAPLSVKKIPMVGTKTYQTLRNLGIKKIHTLQEMPLDLLQSVFGKNGTAMWKKANGIDFSPIVPYHDRKSISTERTFDKDTIDVNRIKSILTAMAENLAFQLRRGNKLTGCVTVKVRYSDFNTYTHQHRIPYSSTDHIIIPTVLELFKKLYQRRLLIRLIGVRMSHLVGGAHQINMFEDEEDTIKLYQAMDKMRDKYGDRKIVRASGMDAKTISRFNPFTGDAPILLPNRRK